jgi:hypothetical protein
VKPVHVQLLLLLLLLLHCWVLLHLESWWHLLLRGWLLRLPHPCWLMSAGIQTKQPTAT